MPESLRDVARAALLEITSESSIGADAGEVNEGDGVVSVLFQAAMPGYPGWHWTVSIAQLEGEEPSVLEAELMPAEGALLSPDWVPWSDRLADYKAAQEALGEDVDDDSDDDESDDDDLDDAEDDADEESDDSDDDDSDDDDLDDDDEADSLGGENLLRGDVLHGGDLDGVDIDELDVPQGEAEDSEDEDDESDDEGPDRSY